MIADRDDHIIVPSKLPVLYEPPAQYTNKTPTLTPLLIPALTALVIGAIQWTGYRLIESAPISVVIATFVIAAFILAVIYRRDWLNFKRPYLFVGLLSGLVLLWVAVCGIAFFYLRETPSPSSNEIELTKQLAAARRNEDILSAELQAAKRDHGDTSPSRPIPPIPPSLKPDEIDARLDAWKGVKAQLNDIDRLLAEGDDILKTWESDNQQTLSSNSGTYANDASNQRNRLRSLLNNYHDFSDLSVVDTVPLEKLAAFIQQLNSAVSQLPPGTGKEDFVHDIEPFVKPVKRQINLLKDWSKVTRKVADSSILELNTRQ
jgi:hypothetical protein